MVSFFLVMMHPSLIMRGSRVYSVNAFRISSLAMDAAEHPVIALTDF